MPDVRLGLDQHKVTVRFSTAKFPEVAIDGYTTYLHLHKFCHMQSQVSPEEEIQKNEIRRTWRTNNRSKVTNPPHGICSMKVVTNPNKKGLVYHRT
ncbi:hypothetical protein TNCV_4422591 [Trichonephila clavipes]|nr:hypothetical protein TNCV_4422591 [Trichonephila clavipes]